MKKLFAALAVSVALMGFTIPAVAHGTCEDPQFTSFRTVGTGDNQQAYAYTETHCSTVHQWTTAKAILQRIAKANYPGGNWLDVDTLAASCFQDADCNIGSGPPHDMRCDSWYRAKGLGWQQSAAQVSTGETQNNVSAHTSPLGKGSC